MENWKPIAEFDGIYEVSDCGRVRRAKACRGTRAGRVTKTCPDKDGYIVVTLSIQCKKYNRKVHRLVATEFIPNLAQLPEVNHKDTFKTNNSVNNLEWCTHPANQAHAAENNLMAKGTANGAWIYWKSTTFPKEDQQMAMLGRTSRPNPSP